MHRASMTVLIAQSEAPFPWLGQGVCTSFKLFFSVLTEIFDLEEIHNDRIKLTAKTVDEDLLVVNVRSLEKRSNQPKYKEPRTRSPKTTAKLI